MADRPRGIRRIPGIQSPKSPPIRDGDFRGDVAPHGQPTGPHGFYPWAPAQGGRLSLPEAPIYEIRKITKKVLTLRDMFYTIFTYIFFCAPYAHVAQTVEHIIGNDVVTGSIPVVG